MIERHERGTYDHDDESEAALLSYVYKAIRGAAFEEVGKYRHWNVVDFAGNPVEVEVVPPADVDEEGLDSLEDLQEMGRVQPVNWHWRGYGEAPSSLSPEDQELAEKLMANLTDEELAILDASVGRSEEKASAFLKELGYNISRSTYRRRLMKIKEKVKPLLSGYLSFSGDE
jgi:hypothetical protein